MRKAKHVNKFVYASASLPTFGILYHAIPGREEGAYIKTGSNYGAEIPETEREKLGIPADGHTPLVFAATTFDKAVAFTIIKGEKLFNSSIGSAETEIAVVCAREKFMSRPRDATIYALPDTGFVQLTNVQNQSVSTQPVPFTATKEVAKIKSADDMMRAGLQIFSFKGDFSTVYESDAAKKLNQASPEAMPVVLAGLIRSGTIVWENNDRGINPNTSLAQLMGIKIKTPSAAVTQKKTSPKQRPEPRP